MAMLELLFLAVLGWQMFAALTAPLLYLFFLVPFGAFLTPALQDFTAVFIDVGLKVLGIPHYSDAYIIEIPEGRFFVAEACAGLRFLIASIAFGVLYAMPDVSQPVTASRFHGRLDHHSDHRQRHSRARHRRSRPCSRQRRGAAADHILYGWMFFSIVIMLLILAGLPFRQDPAGAPVLVAGGMQSPDEMNGSQRRALFTAVLGIGMVSVVMLGVTGWLDRSEKFCHSPDRQLRCPCGLRPGNCRCERARLCQAAFCLPGGSLEVTVQVFSPRVNPARIVLAQRQLTGEQEAEDPIYSSLDIATLEPGNGAFVTTEKPVRSTAFALWVDGRPAAGGLAGRLLLARTACSVRRKRRC